MAIPSPYPTIRLLSLWEPWASLMALHYKHNETRSWSTPYRGFVAIHAAKRNSPEIRRYIEEFRAEFPQINDGVNPVPFGRIVAVGLLRNVVTTERARKNISAREMKLGDYSNHRFAWLFPVLHRLPRPIPFTASQGLIKLDDDHLDVVAEIVAQLPTVNFRETAPEHPPAGVCQRCGCSELHPCLGGNDPADPTVCFWANAAHTLCSFCR